jgi:intein/homing endonuclease
MKYGNGINSYMLIKSIAEELRGLAVEYNVPIVTATQPNRCLTLDTIVKHKNKGDIEIKDLVVGDEILSKSEYVTVKKVFPIEEKKVYEITTESGKIIRCSSSHLFPTANGLKSIESGLSISDELFSIG